MGCNELRGLSHVSCSTFSDVTVYGDNLHHAAFTANELAASSVLRISSNPQWEEDKTMDNRMIWPPGEIYCAGESMSKCVR